jgi:DNA gyrase subunit B
VFRSDPDYWGQHVEKLNYLAESMKSLSAVEKAEKLKSGTTAAAGYKLRSELQGKFVDAIAGQSERYMCELFIVEGNSAGGSLTDGRKGPKYHAVLPLRGRVVNTEGMDEDKMLDNKEMYTLFKAIGLGLDINNVMSSATTQEEAMELLRKNARYGKIIISTDADADGSIIASGLLYTFSRFARFMIDLGMVYLIESPIFSQDGKYFFPSDPTVDGEIPVGLNLKKHFRRYKGLGSLNSDEVYEAFYNPAKRRLIQVTPDGIDYAMSLVEDIQNRKNLLVSKGILGNPYGLFD